MAEPITAFLTACILILTGFITIHVYETSGPDPNDYWYDFWNYYLDFSPSHTSYIDVYIMSYFKDNITSRIIGENNQAVPGYGTYVIEYPNVGKVGLIKTYRQENNVRVVYYKAYSAVSQLLDDLNKEITNSRVANQVDVCSIDTSTDTPSIKIIKKLCGKSKLYQQETVDEIMEHYQNNDNKNTKVILHGLRGVGKSYVGRLLKLRMEEDDNTVRPLLFDDFNPASIGVNVNTMILSKATQHTPVIIIIDDMDNVYNSAINTVEVHDARLQHTSSIQTFHKMLDNIGDTKYVIAIYTMESDPNTLRKHIEHGPKYSSFMRKGRIDIITKMTNEGIETITL